MTSRECYCFFIFKRSSAYRLANRLGGGYERPAGRDGGWFQVPAVEVR